MRHFVLETVLIVVGVLAALSVDQWKEQRDAHDRANTALQSIREEIATNREAVQGSLDYHRGRIGFLFSYANPDSAGRRPQPFSFPKGFVGPANVLSTSWESAREIGALETLDYSLVLKLSRVYEAQEQYQLQKASVAQILYSTLLERGSAGILEKPLNLATIVSTFSYREQELLGIYDDILPELGEQP